MPSGEHDVLGRPDAVEHPPGTPAELRRETWVRASSRVSRGPEVATGDLIGELRVARGEPLPHEHSHVVTVSGRVERLAAPSESVPDERTAVVDREAPSPVDYAALLDRLDDAPAEIAAEARATIIADADSALPHIMRRFPGRLSVDPFAALALPPLPACGALLSVVAELAPAAHAYVSERLDDPIPAVRLMAVHFYAHLVVPEILPRLTRRLHDEEPQVARVAVNALALYRDQPGFPQVLAHLHSRLSSPSPNARRHAARLLGSLRDGTAVPLLAATFDRRDKPMFEAVEAALAEITRQRLGSSTKKWLAWWESHRRLTRVDWLLEALDVADESLRRAAADELRAITGIDPGFQENAPKRARDDAKRKWSDWWSARPRV